jgi:hypothetical protein
MNEADRHGALADRRCAAFDRSAPNISGGEHARQTRLEGRPDTHWTRPPQFLLLTIPNQLGVDYNAHVLESIFKYVAPELGWR